MVASLLISPDSASATTPLSLRVKLKGADNSPILGQTVELCHQGSGEWVCTVDAENTSGSDGYLTASLELPNDSGPVLINSGGPGTSYSRNSVLVFFRNGNLSTLPELTLTSTSWITVKVLLLDSGEEVPNEWVRLSILESADHSWTESAETQSTGIATFDIDRNKYEDALSEIANRSVIAKFGQFGSKYNSTQTTITLDELDFPVHNQQVTLNTSSVMYTLSGTVTDYDHTVESPSIFNNRKMCLRYSDPGTSRGIERDFETAADGTYEIDRVTNRTVSFQPFPCGGQDNWRTYDDIPNRTVSVEDSAATLDFQVTRTRLKVKVTYLEGTTVVPAAFVYVGVDGLNDDFEPQDRKVELTDADGFATFTGLLANTSYEVSFRQSDREYEAPRFQNKVLETTLTTGVMNSVNGVVPVLSLDKIEPFSDLPVSLEGTVFSASGIAIPNAEVEVSASYGNEPGKYVNYRVRTDKFGKYKITSLPYGSIRIEVSASRFRSFERTIQTTEDDDVLVSGQYEDIDFRIRASASGSLEYSGVLRDSSGTPIPDIELILNYPGASGGEIQRQWTDPEGRFVFGRLTPGQYFVFPNAGADFAWTTWTVNVSPGSFPQNASWVLMGKNESNSGNLARVSGRVVEYLDTDGPNSAEPIEGVCVEVYPTQGGSGTVATTDEDGKWSASGLIEGEEYSVGTPSVCPGEDSQIEIFDVPSKYELPAQSASLVIARAAGGVRHQWSYMEVSRSGLGSITGRIKDAENYANLPGVLVRIERIRGGIEIDPSFTDDRGEYSFENLPAGDYFLIVEGSSVGDYEYQSSTVSVDVREAPNRVNAILTRTSSAPSTGIASGVVRDEFDQLHENGRVEVFDATNSSLWRTAQTNENGEFEIAGLPVGKRLSLRVVPFWSEIAIFSGTFTINPQTNEIDLDIDLENGSSISGQMYNIPQGQFSKPIIAELLEDNGGVVQVVNSAVVNSVTGLYEIGQVPIGEYMIRFTQNPTGSQSGSSISESVSVKPVYWDGSRFGTAEPDQAGEIEVASEGEAIASKNVTFSRGAILQGSLSVATSSGATPLTGSRSVFVNLYKETSGEQWRLLTSSEISGSSEYEYQFVGLDDGNYKMHFIDSRRGENSLTSNFNGNAANLNSAPVIEIDNSQPETINHVMSTAVPEKSAEAFDLDDLGAEALAQLKDEIALSLEASAGSDLEIFVGAEFAGEYVSAFANSTPVLLGDWKQVNSAGYITVTIPTTLPAGSHRVAAQDSRGVVFGWAPISITGQDAVSPNPGADSASALAGTTSSNNSGESDTDEDNKEPAANEDTVSAPDDGELSTGDWLLALAGAFLILVVAGSAWMIRSRRETARK
jgi:hypothetical protein